MATVAARRRFVTPAVEQLAAVLPFGPSETPHTVRKDWIESMVRRFGFTEPQAAFTAHAASLGGLFTTRQAEAWLRSNWHEWSADWPERLARRARVRFLQPLFCPAGQRSPVAKAFQLSEARAFSHVANRSCYETLGHANSKYRRLPRASGIVQRLVAYDYILDHSALRWYALTRTKLELMRQLGVARSDLPQRSYQSRYDPRADTPLGREAESVQYFVDHLPIGISPGWRLVFLFVPEPGRPHGLYRQVATQYRKLFRVLRARGIRVSVTVALVPGEDFPTAEADRFRQLAQDPSSLDRERLFLHVEAQLLKRALRLDETAVVRTYGGPDAVQQRLARTRDALVDLRGVVDRPADVYFWSSSRLETATWSTRSRAPGGA